MMGIRDKEDSSSSSAPGSDMVLIEDCTTAISDGIQKASISEKPKTPRSARKRYVKPKGRQWDNARSNRLSCGVRVARRCEHLNELLAMVDDFDAGEEEFVDLVEPQLSAFAELFMEKEKMMVWNDFINHTEEEQDQYLKHNHYSSETNEVPDNDKAAEKLERENSWEILEDKRSVHPAHSSEECFEKISQNLRTLLHRKQLPWGMVSHLETEIIEYFSQWPDSVFLCQLENSYERLLLHAVCQYHMLKSKSFDDSAGIRRTQVENKNEYFRPPSLKLTEYVDTRIHPTSTTEH